MLKRGFKDFLAQANAMIEIISVQDLPYLLDDADVRLIDVRDANERSRDGSIPGSYHAPRGMLEFHADPESPVYIDAFDPEKRLIIYCGTGGRSALAAKTLVDMGFKEVASMAGGFSAWQQLNGKGVCGAAQIIKRED